MTQNATRREAKCRLDSLQLFFGQLLNFDFFVTRECPIRWKHPTAKGREHEGSCSRNDTFHNPSI